MRPKGKLFALLVVFVAIGLVTASGAFTTVTASRTADVSTAGDDSALLQLTEGSGTTDGNGNDYVTGTSDELQIDLTKVNANATTSIEDAINVTNQGTQTVALDISKFGDNQNAIAFAVDENELNTSGNEDFSWANTQAYQINGSMVNIDPGETVEIGIYIDTSDGEATDGLSPGSNSIKAGNEIITEVRFVANAESTGTAAYDLK